MYEHYRADVVPTSPSPAAILNLFGTWQNALESAGIPYLSLESRSLNKKWSAERVITAVRKALEEMSADNGKESITVKSYSQYRKERKKSSLDKQQYPDLRIISICVGTWNQVVKLAGFEDERTLLDLTPYGLIASLQEVRGALEVSKLTQKAYKAYREQSQTPLPTHYAIKEAFGSWVNACQAAGIETYQPQRKWTDSDILAAVSEASRACALNGKLTTGQYDAYCRGAARELPSAGYVRRCYGWTKALVEVGFSAAPNRGPSRKFRAHVQEALAVIKQEQYSSCAYQRYRAAKAPYLPSRQRLYAYVGETWPDIVECAMAK